jgi:hypothetical protein
VRPQVREAGHLIEQLSGDDFLLGLVAEWSRAGGYRGEIGQSANAVVLLTPKVVDPEKPTISV